MVRHVDDECMAALLPPGFQGNLQAPSDVLLTVEKLILVGSFLVSEGRSSSESDMW